MPFKPKPYGTRGIGSHSADIHLSDRESFENIYLDLQPQPGKCRFAESGLGWKPAGGSEAFTIDGTNIAAAQWSRASKGYELKIFPKSSGVLQFDGFDQEVYAPLATTTLKLNPGNRTSIESARPSRYGTA